jgi:anaerobic C4-dicarboxylate transporter DcuB
MVTIGWGILFLILIVSLHLNGIALGLLSGLGLGLLTFFRYLQPTLPPDDLIILQASWLIFIATLEAVGFFGLLEQKFKIFAQNSNNYACLLLPLVSYCLVFWTGDRKWVSAMAPTFAKIAITRKKRPIQFLAPIGIATHMALLASPLSISGILLLLVVSNSALPALALVGMIVRITLGITFTSSLLFYLMPRMLLTKLDIWFSHSYNDDIISTVTESQEKKQATYLFLSLLLLLIEFVFLVVKPQSNALTAFICSEHIIPVRLPMFFALVLLSVAAVAMLSFRIKPTKVIQANRFKWSIQQFFVFFGLVWFVETLVSNDQASLIKILGAFTIWNHYLFYLVLSFYTLLIEVPIVIWLFVPLLIIGCHITILNLALLLVIVHGCSKLRFFLVKSHIPHLPQNPPQ